MALSAAAIQARLEGKLTTAGWVISAGNAQILTKAIAETIHEELTTVAKVNGGTCASGGPISNGAIT
jgi:hypothetical protein